LFVIVFGGKQSDSLNTLGYTKYMEMVSSAKTINPQKLLPTARAAHYRSLCVHLQFILWKQLTTHSLNPLQRGWKLDGPKLQPNMTDLEPAPESLLKFVRCKYKLSISNPCDNNTCSYRKHGLKCVAIVEERIVEILKKLFTMILTIVFCQNSSESSCTYLISISVCYIS